MQRLRGKNFFPIHSHSHRLFSLTLHTVSTKGFGKRPGIKNCWTTKHNTKPYLTLKISIQADPRASKSFCLFGRQCCALVQPRVQAKQLSLFQHRKRRQTPKKHHLRERMTLEQVFWSSWGAQSNSGSSPALWVNQSQLAPLQQPR